MADRDLNQNGNPPGSNGEDSHVRYMQGRVRPEYRSLKRSHGQVFPEPCTLFDVWSGLCLV